MMLKVRFQLIILIAWLLIIGFPVASSEMVIEGKTEPIAGDYVKYSMVADAFIDTLGEEMGEDDYLNSKDIEYGEVELKITGMDTVSVSGTTYNTYMSEYSWELSFTLVFVENTTGLDDEELTVSYDSIEKSWISKEKHATVKSESILTYSMAYKINGTSHLEEYEDIDTSTYSVIGNGIPFPLQVGTTSSDTVTYTLSRISKSRIDGGDWEIESEDEEITETEEVEILSENSVVVPAGTFNTLKVKVQTHGDSDYSIQYYDENFLGIKMVLYDDQGSPIMTMSMTDYKLTNEKSDDGGDSSTPGFETAGIITAIFVTIFFVRRKGLKS